MPSFEEKKITKTKSENSHKMKNVPKEKLERKYV